MTRVNKAEQFAEDALMFEQRTSFLAKNPDTAENFRAYHAVMKHALVAAGEEVRSDVPQPPPRFLVNRVSDISPPRPHAVVEGRHAPARVGFFMPTASLLAHSVNLLTLLQGLGLPNRADPLDQRRLLQPFIYTFGAKSEEFDGAYARWEPRYITADSLTGHWKALREASIADGLDAMVFVSVVQGMAFATSMGVAPKHIWWAHKWHGLDLPRLDGYIDACHPFHEGPIEIAGRTWTSTYTALPPMFDAAKTEEAQRLRGEMDVKTVFGWMGRDDKITPDYVAAVIEILKASPDAIYVYTGRQNPDWIAAAFEESGVGERVAFLGWVDTKLWAQVIDVYLDTFPFQSGHCAYEAMAACKPVIWLHDAATAQEQSASGLIDATWEMGASAIFPARPFFYDVVDYVQAAIRYAEAAPDVRADAGRLWGQWLDRFMMDKAKMAASVSQAIIDVING